MERLFSLRWFFIFIYIYNGQVFGIEDMKETISFLQSILWGDEDFSFFYDKKGEFNPKASIEISVVFFAKGLNWRIAYDREDFRSYEAIGDSIG